METNLISVPQAAQLKGCTAQALRNAIQRGDLNSVRLGPRATMILQDDAFHAYQVPERGGRTHTAYKESA